jgi:hypothetical protein
LRRPRYKALIAAGLIAGVALAWFVVDTIRGRRPYSVADRDLSGWKVIAGPPGGAVVALQPPPELSAKLFREISRRTNKSLIAPERPLVPIVLPDEYADSLQGVLSVDDIIEIAKGEGLDMTRFEPVCVARSLDSRSGRVEELFSAIFEASAYAAFRQQLTPLFPEHAGSVNYEPAALHLMLPVAATGRELAGRSIGVDREAECVTRIQRD